jgi:hypothetical protein
MPPAQSFAAAAGCPVSRISCLPTKRATEASGSAAHAARRLEVKGTTAAILTIIAGTPTVICFVAFAVRCPKLQDRGQAMTTRRVLLRRAALAFLAPSIVRAQATWPNKPITIVVNAAAGGQTDAIALTGRRQCLACSGS